MLEIFNFFISHLKDTLFVLFLIIYYENAHVLKYSKYGNPRYSPHSSFTAFCDIISKIAVDWNNVTF
jgi:hypothetical protein